MRSFWIIFTILVKIIQKLLIVFFPQFFVAFAHVKLYFSASKLAHACILLYLSLLFGAILGRDVLNRHHI